MPPDLAPRRRPATLQRAAAPSWALALVITGLLGACSPHAADPPLAAGPSDRPDLTMPRTPSTDASLPSASSVFDAPVAAAQTAAITAEPGASTAQARANTEMTPAQESRAMPLPGQANDHSVPVSPPKAAASR